MTSSIDWIRLQPPPGLRRRLAAHQLNSILEIHTVDPSIAIAGVEVPVHIVSCYSDRSRILCVRWPDAIVLLHNSYLTSFIHHIAVATLVGVHGQAAGLPPTADIIAGLGKKLVAEQMHVIAPSQMARVMFLEAAIAYESSWRRVIALKDADPALRRSADLFARLTSDFLLNHEMGHAAAGDTRFDPFTRDWVERRLAGVDLTDFDEGQARLLREEATADVFSLNTCLARYAPMLSADTLRNYLIFLARTVTVMNVLYAFAADLHRANVDPGYAGTNVEGELMAWSHREATMIEYLEAFPFSDETVVAQPNDDVVSLAFDPVLFKGLWDGVTLVTPPSEDARLLAEVIGWGFEAQSFDRVIEGMRAHRLLSEDD